MKYVLYDGNKKFLRKEKQVELWVIKPKTQSLSEKLELFYYKA